jgi:hypothetical protein
MSKLDMEKLERKPVSESPVVDPAEEVVDSIEGELTDEQLLQMAEGSCSWGANCHGASGK